MRNSSSPRISFSFQLTLAIVTVGVLCTLILAGYATFLAERIDARALKREQVAVGLFLKGRLTRMQSEQQSITAWDDAAKFTAAGDVAWIAENIGVYMHVGFDHDIVFVLDPANEPTYAMSGGVSQPANLFRHDAAALLPMVHALRAQIHGEGGRPDLGVADFAMVQGRPSLVTVKLVVPYTDKMKLAVGNEAIHISVSRIDSGLMDGLAAREQIQGVRFLREAAPSPDLGSFAVSSKAGTRIGSVVWQSERPGTQLIAETAPALIGLAFLIVGFMTFLIVKLRAMAADRDRIQAETEHLARHDPLTGLPNRAMFNDALDAALARSTGAVALHYVDLDRFKHVNDTLGHPAGDDLIRQVARRLEKTVGPQDTVARLGGDEFAIIQPDVRDQDDAARIASAMLEAVRRPFTIGADRAVIGASIGIAAIPAAAGRSDSRDELMRKADIALYEAKGAGKNRFSLFETRLDEAVQGKRRIEADLHEALESGAGLRVAYQPLYGTDGATIMGAEALLRWDHPVHGTISPAVFIPVAEERGLIVELGDFVLREACRTAREIDLPWIAVNVSATQLRDASFPRRVLELLRENGLTANRIELEITEGVLLDGTEAVADALRQLRALGIRIALDDFGTGYSSLQYLHRYPVDKIKIDRSFVIEVANSTQSQALVKAMVDVARAFDMDIVAEGVETPSQRDCLASLGCGQLQGFLFAKAMRPEDLNDLVEAKASLVA